MRLLHVIPGYLPAYWIGGPVKATHELCRQLACQGIDTSVFTTDIGINSNRREYPFREDIEGVKVTYFHSSFLRRYNHAYGFARALKEYVHDYDIVHIHSVFSYTTLAAGRICIHENMPYIINPFGALDRDMINLRSAFLKRAYIYMAERRNIESAFLIQVASQYEKERFLALGFSANAAVVPPGLKIEDYDKSPKPLSETYPQLKGMKVILYLGRIHPKKGIGFLLDAFKKIANNKKDVFLVMAGPVDHYAKIIVKSVSTSPVIKDKVIFTGMLFDADKLSAFYGSDVFVLPSYGENFAVSALEAMACKRPVIVTDKVGLCPDIQEYGAGIIIKQDADAIEKAVFKVLDDKAASGIMGENGRRLVKDRFSIDITAGGMIKIYEGMLRR